MTISMERKYTYRNGEPARILCVDAPVKYPVRSMDENGHIWTHACNGVSLDGAILDLIEVKEKKTLEFWVNVYEDGGSERAYDEETAVRYIRMDSRKAVACKHVVITYEEGEGL